MLPIVSLRALERRAKRFTSGDVKGGQDDHGMFCSSG
jgi:hypothetical protein